MKLLFMKLKSFISSFWKISAGKRSLSGSSFLELAVAMAVLGVLASSSIQTEVGIEDRKSELITEQRIKKIQDAMVLFLKNNKRLPCPSSLTDRYDAQLGAEEIYGTISNPNMTINICSTPTVRNDLATNARIIPSPEIYRAIIHKTETPTAYGSFYADYPKIPPAYLIQGAVPTATLGLKPEDGLDGFGRKIFYSVHTILTNNKTSNPHCMSSSAYGRIKRYCFEGSGNSETQFTAHSKEMDYELSSTRYLPIFNLTFNYSDSFYGYAKGYAHEPFPYCHLDTVADVRAAYALVTTDKNGKGGVNKFGVRNGCPDLAADKVNIGGVKAGCTDLIFNNYNIEPDVLYDIKVNNATKGFVSSVNIMNQKLNTKVFPVHHIDLLMECNEGLNNGCQSIEYAYLKDDPEETGCFTRNDCPKNECGENKVCSRP